MWRACVMNSELHAMTQQKSTDSQVQRVHIVSVCDTCCVLKNTAPPNQFHLTQLLL